MISRYALARRALARYALALLIAVLGTSLPAQAQEATERFIPIGQSPGLSGKQTMLGEIRSVDAEARTIEVATSDRTYRVAVTDATRIWVDRSQEKLPAVPGTMADCQQGREIEVKPQDGNENVADWIKVRPAAR